MSLNRFGREFVEHTGMDAGPVVGIKRAMEELAEALMATHFETPNAVADEFADVILTLAASAAVMGLNLDEACMRKHARNLKAQWTRDELTGAVKRVKEPK